MGVNFVKSKQFLLLLAIFVLSAVFVLAAAPSIDTLSLTSSNPSVNGTKQNITLETTTSDGDGDDVKLIAHWQLDGDDVTLLNVPFEAGLTKDYTGTISSITNNGVLLEAGNGADGFGSASFDGASFLDLGNSSELATSDDVTVSLWAKAGSITKNQGLFAVGDDEYNRGKYRTYTILRSGDDARFKIGNSTKARNVRCKDVLADGSDWVHLVGVKEGLTIRIYADGVLCQEKENIDVDSSLINGEQVFIGAMGSKGKRFNGSLDDIMVFNRALDEEQIKNLYTRNNQIHNNLTQKGQTWRVEVTPVDASEEGTMVSDEFTVANTRPQEVDDNGFVIVENTTLIVDVLANDYDVDGDAFSFYATAVTSPRNGTSAKVNDTHVSYTPDPGHLGFDIFSYVINDTDGARSSGQVRVTVVASDLVAPEFSDSTPSKEVDARSFEVSTKVVDNIAVANVYYELRNASNETIESGFMTDAGSDVYTFTQSALVAGNYTVYVIANDTSLEGPNSATTSWGLEVLSSRATTFELSQDASSVDEATMQLDYSTTLPASFTLTYGVVEGNLSETQAGESNSFNSSFNVSGLSSGTTYFYQLSAQRYDGAENITHNGSLTTVSVVSASSTSPSSGSSGGGGIVVACSDGRDNDGDGLIDLADGGCENGNDRSEAGGDAPSTSESQEEDAQESESSFSVSGNVDEGDESTQSSGNALTGAVVGNQEGSGNGKTGIIVAVVLLVLLAGAYFFTKGSKGAKKPKKK